MPWVSALNIVWLAIGAVLLAAMLRAGRHKPTLSWQAVVRTLVVAATLFPFISASDDQLWLENRSAACEHQDDQTARAARGLLTLYQVIDSSVTAAPIAAVRSVSFEYIKPEPAPYLHTRLVPGDAGRSPPTFVCVS